MLVLVSIFDFHKNCTHFYEGHTNACPAISHPALQNSKKIFMRWALDMLNTVTSILFCRFVVLREYIKTCLWMISMLENFFLFCDFTDAHLLLDDFSYIEDHFTASFIFPMKLFTILVKEYLLETWCLFRKKQLQLPLQNIIEHKNK